jgi:broad specificity phosphatase PhoE
VEQKWPSTLVIVRHGESELNVALNQALSGPGVESYGHGLRNVDASLTGKGMEQARLTGEFLSRNYNFDFVFASPYRRSVQTTQAIAQSLTGPVIIRQEERVREIEYGAIDGLTPEGLKKAYPLEYERREREGKYWYRPPGGESHPDVALRVHSFLGTLTRDCRRKNVLVVCHGVVVLMFRRLIEHWDEDTYLTVARGGDVANCSITAYRFDPQEGRLLLNCFNTTAYEKK